MPSVRGMSRPAAERLLVVPGPGGRPYLHPAGRRRPAAGAPGRRRLPADRRAVAGDRGARAVASPRRSSSATSSPCSRWRAGPGATASARCCSPTSASTTCSPCAPASTPASKVSVGAAQPAAGAQRRHGRGHLRGTPRHEFQDVADAADCPVVASRWASTSTPSGRTPARPVDGVLRLVHAGRLSREKSPHLAVATAVELHRRGVPVRMDVYGVGPAPRRAGRARRPDAPVRFRGYVDSPRPISAARWRTPTSPSASARARPSGWPSWRRWRRGTPVVTADRGGARELVDDASGAWAAPEPAALADAVLEVAGPTRWRRRRAAAGQRAERYPLVDDGRARCCEIHSSGWRCRSQPLARPRRVISSRTATAATTREPITIAR